MAEVNVNIRGRDDGLGNHLDSLRQKAIDLGRDLSELNNFDNMTPTQQRVAIGKLSQNTLRDQQSQIQREYDAIRQSNSEYYYQQKERLSPDAFSKFKKEYDYDQDELKKQENDELMTIEREMNTTLKDIYKGLTTEAKIEREKAQRDKSEFRDSGGLQGRLLNENKELRKQQFLSESEDEIARLQEKINANNATMNAMKRGGSGGGGDDGNFRDWAMTAGAAGSGDLMGTVSGGLRGIGNISGFAKAATITGIIAMVLKEALGHGDKLREAVAPVSSFRGGYSTATAFSQNMRATGGDFSIDGRYDLGALGLTNEEQAANMRQKALSSGISGNDLFRRTYEDTAFQKAFGADSGVFSEFERFSKGQDEATNIAMDVLNVLTSIDESSLKQSDLTTLTEKLASQQTILSFQRQKRDLVDNDNALKILAAFESAGLSGKGERAAGFLNQTMKGLGEGGSDVEMMLKIEAAKRARPDLINDPAALRRMVRFNADDPEYMAQFFKMANQMTGGNQMAVDDLLYTFFNPESEADMEIYQKMMAGGKTSELLRGKGLESMKQRKATLNKDTMFSDAENGVGVITEAMADFNNRSQSMMDLFSSALKALVMGDAVNVNILTDKTKKPTSSSPIVGPKAKTGK